MRLLHPAIVALILGSSLGGGPRIGRSADGPAQPRPPQPIRTLILTSEADESGPPTAAILRRILADSGRFDVRINEAPAGLTAASLEGFDLVIDDAAGPVLGHATKEALTAFVVGGKGLLATRKALANTWDLPQAWLLTTAANPVNRAGFVEVNIHLTQHPIVRWLPDRFRIADALLGGIAPSPSVEAIASAPTGSGGKPEPVLLAGHFGPGREVGFGLGHDPAALHEPTVQVLFARAAEWAATGSVTLPPTLATRPPGPGVQGLLVTGGHDHEAAFYALFQGDNDFGPLPVLTSGDAFKADIRGKYEVVIMYDFSRDLSDAGKQNLRDYVAGGGGVVVLHHGLLNYQNWSWWTDEAVGGSYRLTKPSSSVKNDQQIFVTPVPDHPITARLAPFHIEDEAYQSLRYSPRIQPLLTTDNPTSDPVLAWVGPLAGARVVAIQLGHGQPAFRNPAYRTVVHNAVLWAAGKLK